jgi:serine/threonine-protein kinase
MHALARVPADRFATAGQLAAALADPGSMPRRVSSASPARRRWRVASLVLGFLVLGAIGAALLRRPAAPALDSSLLAVAPFDVMDQGLGMWREGMVDLISRNLDGAGPLRTVSPTVVIRRWSGRADPASAVQMGRRTGAGLALFGSLLTAGADSVRLQATLLNVSNASIVGEWELRDVPERVDRLADSLTVHLIRDLGRSGVIGAMRVGGVGSTSLPALKAFLQGEQRFRRAQWDSALTFYEHAIALDSTFSLALRRAGLVLGWTRTGFDSLSHALFFRAARFNRGLSRRDSLLISADSLMASLLEAGPLAGAADSGWSSRLPRLFATLRLSTTQYPDDPESWYLLGEAYEHLGPYQGSSTAQVLAAFDRSIALDSAFAPAYIHPIEVGLGQSADAGRRYLERYIALSPNDVNSDGLRLVARLLDSADAGDAEVFKGVSDFGLFIAFNSLLWYADSGEIRVRLVRFMPSAPRTGGLFEMPGFTGYLLSQVLSSRGHLRAAFQASPWPAPSYLFMLPYVEAALTGVIPVDSTPVVFAGLLESPDPSLLTMAFPWWSTHGDTASLSAAARHAESMARSSTGQVQRLQARYAASSSHAYLTLARRDSALALNQFLQLPDDCPTCVLDRLTTAQLLVEQHRDQEAWEMVRGDFPTATLTTSASEVLWVLLRARVAERLGQSEIAIASYSWVAAMWRNPDPELRSFLVEARQGLERLTGEKPRESPG